MKWIAFDKEPPPVGVWVLGWGTENPEGAWFIKMNKHGNVNVGHYTGFRKGFTHWMRVEPPEGM